MYRAWNLVIYNSFTKKWRLEGVYYDFNKANTRGKENCHNSLKSYKVMDDMEYIQFTSSYSSTL